MGRVLRRAAVALLLFGLLLQLVPYGWRHRNPPVVADAPWPDDESRRLARAACYDCHSNETEWPAYSYVAPMSWLVRRDVEDGRRQLNFSRWGEEAAGEVDEAAETELDGSMPPGRYLPLHADARLSDAERLALAAGLTALEEGAGEDRGRGRSGGNSGPG